MDAQKDLLNLVDAIDRLKRTSFHYRQELVDRFLADQGSYWSRSLISALGVFLP